MANVMLLRTNKYMVKYLLVRRPYIAEPIEWKYNEHQTNCYWPETQDDSSHEIWLLVKIRFVGNELHILILYLLRVILWFLE